MSFTLELKDANSALEIETDKFLDILHAHVQSIVRELSNMNKAVPLSAVLVRQVVGDPLSFTYSFTAKDARVWYQDLKFHSGVRMTFNVPDGWRLDEFAPHRPFRDIIVLLVRDFSLVKLVVTYV